MSDKGTVIKSTGSAYVVRTPEGDLRECRLKGRLRLSGSKSTNPVAVGDEVAIVNDGRDDVIADVLPRRNYIVRRSTNLSKQTHVIAANVDQAVLVCTINHPETSTVFIDRFLASAEAYGVETVLVFNKIDIYDDAEREELTYRTAVYTNMGYKVLHVSAERGEGLDDLRQVLVGKVSALSGHSGVGKSSLVNRIEPGLSLRTDSISEANNAGKHTTTFAEMHHLTIGGDIIDTPGIRGFGVVNIAHAELAHYFKDIFQISHSCRFPNCTHIHEPGCAVMQAAEQGQLAPTRYESYVNIMTEEEGKYR